MKKTASLMLLVGTLLVSSAAISNEMCPELARAASKAAQDYRQAAGKVRAACDSSYEECNQSQVQADQMLALQVAANQAMKDACEFVFPVTDDALPVTAETVAAAIDTYPLSALIDCRVVADAFHEAAIGCPNWVLNVPRSVTTVSPLTATSFMYSFYVNASGSIPVRGSILGSSYSCTLSVTSNSPGVLITGTATFSSSTPGGPFNQLQLTVNSINAATVQFSGCGVIGAILDLVQDTVMSSITQVAVTAYSSNFCGVEGPELFGTCP